MLTHALAAHEAGLCVLPPKGNGMKAPLVPWTTYQHRRSTPDEIRRWYAQGRTGIGVVLGDTSGGLELLEFDDVLAYRHFTSIADKAGIGDLVERIEAGYLEESPNGIHWLYRCSQIEGNTKLARRPKNPDEMEHPGDKVKVLIETRGEGGFAIIAPTHGDVHPSGRPYKLLRGSYATIATITPEEREALFELARTLDSMPRREQRAAETLAQRPNPDDGERPGDWFNRTTTWAQVLEPHGWTWLFEHNGEAYWRRPGKSDGQSATTNYAGNDTLKVFSSSTPFDTETTYTRFAAYAVLEHNGDYTAAAKALADEMPRDDKRPKKPVLREVPNSEPHYEDDPGPTEPGAELSEPRGRHEASDDDRHLPEEVWSARPELKHIREAARARMVAPDAVLGAVLVRIAACTPHNVELPAIVGSPVGLTMFAALNGPPEAGKSAAANVAAELLPAPDTVLDRLPVGSGEGMVEVLFELVEEDDDNGKPKKVKRQTKHAAIFHVDEGAVLSDLGSRSGSTLMPTLRTAWTHGTLGNANASVERRRILDGRSYVYGVTLGIQPELAGPLLADVAAGTPQRFVWLQATDPAADGSEVAWPGALDWEPPDPGALMPYGVTRGGWRRYQMRVAEPIVAEVRADRLEAMRGEVERDGADAHRVLSRLKVAAALALLDGRMDVEADDWALAGAILTTSRNVRRSVEAVIAAAEVRREAALTERHARRELYVERTKENEALTSACKSAARVVTRHAKSKEHDGEGCTKRCMTQAMAGKHRKLVDVEDVIAEAERSRWIERDGDRWKPGRKDVGT